MKKITGALFLFLTSTASIAFAANPCDEKQSTNGMYQCLLEQYTKADNALNDVWGAISSSYRQNGISEARYAALVKAEQVWIAHRDLDCKFDAMAFEGGSFEKVLKTCCLIRKTEERTVYLHDSVFGAN